MDRLNLIHKTLFLKYGKKTKQNYQKFIITNLINSKNCRLVALLKDRMILDFIDEFLKRYYKKKESKNQIPKLVIYYKNYLRFFCKPIFRNFSLNNIIQHNGEKLAEIYYNNNYGKNSKNNHNNNKLKSPNQFKIIFTKSIKESINDISISSNYSNSIQLNQSSFRLLYKNNYGDDFENESIINILNDLNGKKHHSINANQRNKKILGKKVQNIIRYNSPNKDNIKIRLNSNNLIHSQGLLEQKNKNHFNKQHFQLIVEEKNKLVIDALHKENVIKNKFNLIHKSPENNNKFLNKTKLKLKTNPTHCKNTLSNQMSPKIILTEVNNIHKRNQGRSSDLFNNNYYQTYYSRTTDNNYNYNKNNNYNKAMINLKSKNVNKLNKPSSKNFSSRKSNNLISSFNNFEIQQQLLNNGKSYKIKGSFNSSSRNTISNLFSYTQTFSPQSNRFISNFKNERNGNKVYLKVFSKKGKM